MRPRAASPDRGKSGADRTRDQAIRTSQGYSLRALFVHTISRDSSRDRMTDPVSPAGTPLPPIRTRATARTVRSSLRTRIRLYAVLGLLVVGGWLYYTIQAVLGLYDATLQTTLYTDLRQRVTDAMSQVQEASDSLDRYLREGQGYDLSQHYASRTELKGSLGAIRRQPLPVVIGGTFRRAEAAAEVYDTASERAVSTRSALEPRAEARDPGQPGPPAARNLREMLAQLEREFARRQDFGELQLKGSRNAATAALVILAGLILVGLVLLLADVNRRILTPCADAARALQDLVAGRAPPRLSESSNDEIGALGQQLQRGLPRVLRARPGAGGPRHRVVGERGARRRGDRQRPRGLRHEGPGAGHRGHRRLERRALSRRRQGRPAARGFRRRGRSLERRRTATRPDGPCARAEAVPRLGRRADAHGRSLRRPHPAAGEPPRAPALLRRSRRRPRPRRGVALHGPGAQHPDGDRAQPRGRSRECLGQRASRRTVAPPRRAERASRGAAEPHRPDRAASSSAPRLSRTVSSRPSRTSSGRP